MDYFGDAAGNERSAGASHSRKGKKSSSNRPKQPQRGLGVAQLEKTRLRNQVALHPINSSPQMSMGELERSNMIDGLSQPRSNLKGNANNVTFEAEHYAQPGITRNLFQAEVEDSLRKAKGSDSMGSTSCISDSSGSQELDLELRL
ncbi:protein SPEAR1-like [Bidens hawaiensis]|uniref:protein SPEAR1-like n=1 Tax=Bidens hawaiensis TaxID=980011 RepID=UPI00404B0170